MERFVATAVTPANANTRANFHLSHAATLSAASFNAPVVVFDSAIDPGIGQRQ